MAIVGLLQTGDEPRSAEIVPVLSRFMSVAEMRLRRSDLLVSVFFACPA
jgi:hypothetical protein